MFCKKITHFGIILSLLIFLPSCIKYYELSEKEFPQGINRADQKEVIDKNLRSTRIYDEFETKAIFDVLWLSNETRTTYVSMNCKKTGKDESSKQALLRRQLEENKHWITFYILSDVRDRIHISLTDQNSLWSFYLKLDDGKIVRPISIKEFDFEPEYQFLFGYKFNIFKRSYIIKFPAVDLSGKHYLQKDKEFNLVVCSPFKEAEISWQAPEFEEVIIKGKKIKRKVTRKVLKNEDYYWI